MNKNKQKYIISNVNDFKEIVKGFGVLSFTEFINKIQRDTFIFKDGLLYIDKKNNEHCSLFKEIYLSSILGDFNIKKIIDGGNILYSIINIANLQVLRNTEFKGNENIYLIKSTEFSNCKFKNLKISILKECKKIIIRGGKGKRIFILNTVIEGNIFLDNIEIGELILENINNNFESFEIRNCKIDKLVIKNSNLGKAVFNGVEIGELEIENATLNDCIFNGVDFKNYELTEIKKENSVNYKIMKDNYRQLKHVMDKNGNHTEANKFYALEMEYYMKYINDINVLTYKKILSNIFYIKESSNYGEKLILDFNYLVNYFGTNIVLNLYNIITYLAISYSSSFLYSFILIIKNGELTTVNNKILSIFLSIICFFLLFVIKKIVKKYPYSIFIILIFLVTLFGYYFNIPNIDGIHFKGIETLIYLFNPFSGLTPNSISHLDTLEQLGMIIHKIIYGILIYQLIIALKRTTRR